MEKSKKNSSMALLNAQTVPTPREKGESEKLAVS
jgi:hypothetical protein